MPVVRVCVCVEMIGDSVHEMEWGSRRDVFA